MENSLKAAALWDEVKDKLNQSGLSLSGGQQQRLCIARALAVEPEVILMDEPASALDPISTLKIEELMQELKKDYTIVIVTHNMQQAARVSDYTAMMMIDEAARRASHRIRRTPTPFSPVPRTSAPKTTLPGGLDSLLYCCPGKANSGKLKMVIINKQHQGAMVQMRKTFETEIQQLKDEMLLLGSMVEQQILDSVDALKKRDMDASRRIQEMDARSTPSAMPSKNR